MKVTFIDAGGVSGTWDGCLWESPGDTKMALSLNREPLPECGPHDSIVERARKQLTYYCCKPPQVFEIVDQTGWPKEFPGEDVIFVEEELEAGREGAQNDRHDGTAKTSPEDSALAAAEAHLGGGVCTDAPDDENEDDWDAPEREWGTLIAWCKERDLICDGPGPQWDGGREHDVRFDNADGRWWKYTKPNLAGYTVDWSDAGEPFLRNARPSEYLARLRRQNTVLEDGIKLEGVWWQPGLAGGWRIVTSQPDVPGRTPTMEEIREGMETLGFKRLRWVGIGYEFAEAWRIGRMVLWDVHPSNVVLSEPGVIVPIDVIITPLPDGFPPCHLHP